MGLGLFGTKKFVGLDIGHFAIKAMQVERNANGWKVSKYGTAPTPINCVVDGIVADEKAVSEAIRELLATTEIQATSAVLAVGGAPVLVRTSRVPKMSEDSLRRTLRFEAGRFIPTSAEESFIDFEITGFPDESNMDIMVCAAPRNLVNSRITTCELAGLDVEVVEAESFACYRALVEADQNHDWARSSVALLDIGATTTNMSLVEAGVFQMVRSFNYGGQVLNEALKTHFKIDQEQAEEGKSLLDVTPLMDESKPCDSPALKVIQTHLDDLVREVRRSLNYYQSQLQAQQPDARLHIDAVLLTGGASKLNGFAHYVESRLGIPTIALGLFDNPKFATATSGTGGMDYSVAGGLAMRAHLRAA